MADHAWLQNLAAARYAGGEWVHSDPGAVRRLAEERLARAVSELEEQARDYAEALSDLSRGHRALRVLPLATGAGFMLLLGRCQVTVTFRAPRLEATLTTVCGFQRQQRPLYCLAPQADAFGSLAWRADNSLILTGELIIKRLFEDITRAAFEAGEVALSP